MLSAEVIEILGHVLTVSDIPVTSLLIACHGSSDKAEYPEAGVDVQPRSAAGRGILSGRQRQSPAFDALQCKPVYEGRTRRSGWRFCHRIFVRTRIFVYHVQSLLSPFPSARLLTEWRAIAAA